MVMDIICSLISFSNITLLLMSYWEVDGLYHAQVLKCFYQVPQMFQIASMVLGYMLPLACFFIMVS